MALSLIVSILAAAAPATGSYAIETARVKACAMENIPKYDDRVSPAKDIASAVAESCRNEIQAWIYSGPVAKGDNPERMHAMLFAHFLEGTELVPLVLQARAVHISSGTQVSEPQINTSGELTRMCQSPAQTDHAFCLTYLKAWRDAYVWGLKRCFNSNIRSEEDLKDVYVTNATLFPPKAAKTIADAPPGLVLADAFSRQTHACK